MTTVTVPKTQYEILKKKVALYESLLRPIHKLSKEDTKIARLTLNFINRYRRDLEALARK